jgi:UDP-4-amino-4,6-dideoxy-N-acetyl-beta-L-altrosamine N-acetyltransferase
MSELGVLRKIRTEELELMLSWRNAPSIRSNMYTSHVISAEEHLAWWNKISEKDDVCYFMYEFKTQPMGIVGLTAIDNINKNCSWAFYSSPEAPKGTGSKMEFVTLEKVFNELRLHKIYCEVLASNTPVLKLHQKFGFQVEGIFKEQCLKEEKFIDIYRLGLLKNDWISINESLKTRLLSLSKINK